MSRISVHSTGRRGFTLVEVVVASSLAGIVCVSVLAAYLFLGRNLTRLINVQRQDVQSRNTLWRFTTDLSAAIEVKTATASQITISRPTSSSTVDVSYTYSSASGTFVRAEGTATPQTLLTGLTSLAIAYYNAAGAATTSPRSVKSVELSFASASGSSFSGTHASLGAASPRIVLRNKQALQ